MLRLSRSFVERLIMGATFIKVFTTKFELPRLVREHHNFRELFESLLDGATGDTLAEQLLGQTPDNLQARIRLHLRSQ